MHRTSSAMIAGLLLAAGAATIAQTGSQPGTTGASPGRGSEATRQPPGQVRTPPGQERVPPGQAGRDVRMDQQSVERIIANWPQESQKAAKETMQKYGPPNGVTSSMLVWEKNGPWKKTVVFSEPIEHLFPMKHMDVLQSTIDYKVPLDQYDELARFDGSIIAFRTGGELSARCDAEAANFLALNLAHEIVTGKRTVEEARQFYAQQIQDHKQGRPSTYTQGLMFEPESNTRDPDRSVMGGQQQNPDETAENPGGDPQPARRDEGTPSMPRNPNMPEPRNPGPPR